MSIHIEGRRWFQKTYGNTYNTVLGENGMPELLETNANGSPNHYGTQYLREVMHGTYSVIDVQRQRDL